MCVIIEKPAGIGALPVNDYEAAILNNPDGFGVMWYEHNAKTYVKRLLNVGAEKVADTFNILQDTDAVFHLRYATRGEISAANVHPFPVLSMADHGRDLWMMHNGTITIDTEGDESDTSAFIRLVVRPLLSRCPELLEESAFVGLVENYVGWSKLVFMDSNGRITKINGESGAQRGDCWVSNLYSFDPSYRLPSKPAKASKKSKGRKTQTYLDYVWEQEEKHTAPEPVMPSAWGWPEQIDSDPFALDADYSYTAPGMITQADLLQMSEQEIYDLVITMPEVAADLLCDTRR